MIATRCVLNVDVQQEVSICGPCISRDTNGAQAAQWGRVVRGSESFVSTQWSAYATGISGETVSATGLFLDLVTLPTDGRTKAYMRTCLR